MDENRMLRCACGWEKRGTLDELVIAAVDHGRRVHNMEPTRDQVLAMVVDDGPADVAAPDDGVARA
jgi:predicted small metal-binding protein